MTTGISCFDAASRKRLYWHSRRGMLELDLLLVPFAENCLAGLDDASIGLYQDLLAQEDQVSVADTQGRGSHAGTAANCRYCAGKTALISDMPGTFAN
jgi:succinate dehydrogenase flavin-adding protein (antitoxin of CptAB toxin-antitoxin module)